MDSEYKQYRNRINMNGVRDVVNISKLIGLPQKTIYSAVAIYYRYSTVSLREDIIPLSAACIMLSGKICGSLRGLEQILKICYIYYKLEMNDISFEENYNKAVRIELKACISLDFDFEMDDPYGYLEKLCLEYDIGKSTAQVIWIILKDLMYLPFTLIFCTRTIVMSCIFISTIIDSYYHSSYDIEHFKNTFRNISLNVSDVVFISEEIILLYEHALEGKVVHDTNPK